MSAAENFGIPEYAKPSMKDLDSFINKPIFGGISSLPPRGFPEHVDPSLDDDDPVMDENCPSCGHEYDEIDYEYQICHFCKFKNNE